MNRLPDWLRTAGPGQNVRSGMREVFIAWGIVGVIGVSSFFLAKRDLDRRRLEAVKKRGLYGRDYFSKSKKQSEKKGVTEDPKSERRAAVQRKLESDEESRKVALRGQETGH